jgi:aminoglycoside phosphotransferase (APT) family kinase protein
MLERYDAGLAPVLERLRTLAESQRLHLETVPPAPIHGAFRFTQLLTYRDRLALVDFDGFRQGDPMVDVGSFVAHLFYLFAKGELAAAPTQNAVAAFLAAYREATPWGTPESALQWYTAVILVAKHAQKCVKRLKDDGDTKIRHMLELAECMLDGRLTLRS